MKLGLVAVLAAALWVGVAGQLSSNCTTAVASLSPCLNYISGNVSNPPPPCCSQLAAVVSSQPSCLCEVLDGRAAAALGIVVNMTLARQLPSACGLQTSPTTLCNAVLAPATSPALPPGTRASPAPRALSGQTPPGTSSDANLYAFGPPLVAVLLIALNFIIF